MIRVFLVVFSLGLLQACVPAAQQELDPDAQYDKRAKAYADLGIELLAQKKPREAIVELDKAVKIEPDLAKAQNALALSYQQIGKIELADKAFQAALRSEPDVPEYNNNYGAFLIGTGRSLDAEPYLKVAANSATYPTPHYAFYNLAKVYIEKEDFVEAHKAINSAIHLQPSFQLAYLERARVLFMEGKSLLAYQEIPGVLAVLHRNQDAQLLAGKIAKAVGKYSEAEVHLGHAIDLNPFSPLGKEAQELLLQLSELRKQ